MLVVPAEARSVEAQNTRQSPKVTSKTEADVEAQRVC